MKTYEITYINFFGDNDDKTVKAESIDEAMAEFKQRYSYKEILSIGIL